MIYNMMWWVSWKQMLWEFHQKKVWSFNLIFSEKVFIFDNPGEDCYKTHCLYTELITNTYLWLVSCQCNIWTIYETPRNWLNNLLSIYRWVKGNYEEIMNCPYPLLTLVTRVRLWPVCSTRFDCSEFALNHQNINTANINIIKHRSQSVAGLYKLKGDIIALGKQVWQTWWGWWLMGPAPWWERSNRAWLRWRTSHCTLNHTWWINTVFLGCFLQRKTMLIMFLSSC